MEVRRWAVLLLAAAWVLGNADASAGDVDPPYRNCVEHCEKSGQFGNNVVQHCLFSSANLTADEPWYMQETLYLRWKQLSCRSDCRYYCMLQREHEREELGFKPVKYHGKWPFKRVSLLQEPLSAALSVLNLVMHINGWLSFYFLLHNRLPMRPQGRKTYYEFTCLWHIYAFLATNAWLWSAVFHSWDIDLTEKLDYSAAVALLGYSLIIAILRTLNVRDEASRVMIAAPLLAFVTTHILYLNFYQLDYGLNMKVCLGMGIAQLLLWAIWAGTTGHPSRIKIWTVVFGGAFAMLLEIYDFPPYKGYADAHSLWHACTIPLTYLWWSFVKDDAASQTSALINKVK